MSWNMFDWVVMETLVAERAESVYCYIHSLEGNCCLWTDLPSGYETILNELGA